MERHPRHHQSLPETDWSAFASWRSCIGGRGLSEITWLKELYDQVDPAELIPPRTITQIQVDRVRGTEMQGGSFDIRSVDGSRLRSYLRTYPPVAAVTLTFSQAADLIDCKVPIGQSCASWWYRTLRCRWWLEALDGRVARTRLRDIQD